MSSNNNQSVFDTAADLIKKRQLKLFAAFNDENKYEIAAEEMRNGNFNGAIRRIVPPGLKYDYVGQVKCLLNPNLKSPVGNDLLTLQKQGKIGIPISAGIRSIIPSALPDVKSVKAELIEGPFEELSLYERALVPEIDVEENNPFKIPVISGVDKSSYYGNGVSISITNPLFAKVAEFSGKKNVARVVIARDVVLAGNPEVINNVITAVLETLIKRGRSYAMLYGAGTSEPMGIKNNTDFSQILAGHSAEKNIFDEAERLVDTSGAPQDGRFYLIHPDDAKTLKSRAAGLAGDKTLIQGGKLNDENYIISNLVTKGDIWYGRWSTALISVYGREILIDPFTKDPDISFTLFDYNDINFRNVDRIVQIQNFD